MEIFPEIGPRKNVLVPPNLAPGLRPCVSAKPSRQCVEAAKEAISTVCTLIRKTTNRVKDTYRPTEVVQMHSWATVEILHTGSHCQKQDMENLRKCEQIAGCL